MKTLERLRILDLVVSLTLVGSEGFVVVSWFGTPPNTMLVFVSL